MVLMEDQKEKQKNQRNQRNLKERLVQKNQEKLKKLENLENLENEKNLCICYTNNMSFKTKNNDNNKPFDPDPDRETAWHGRLSPITGKRETTYTLGSRSDSPVFRSLDEWKRAKRNRKVDPHRDSPIPDIFKTSSGKE